MNNIDSYKVGNSSIKISRDLGCNLFDWQVDGYKLLYTPPGFLETDWDFPLGGNPILIPSVGRTWDRTGAEAVAERYTVAGDEKVYNMPCHGVGLISDWRKTSENLTASEAVINYEMTIPEAVQQAHYPWNLSLAVAFTLSEKELSIDAVVTNRDNRVAPYAFGYHPFFKIGDESRQGLSVHMPIKHKLELYPGLLIPTGNLLPCDPILKMERGVEYDGGYVVSEGSRASIVDEAHGVKIHVDIDPTFELFVVYSSSTGEFVCLEPWSKGLGMFETLKEPGWETRGDLLTLEPGESKHIGVKYWVEL